MEYPLPRDLNRRQVEHALSKANSDHSTGERIDIISRHFLGHPYKTNPLIGSSATPEVFTAAMDGFDCVTYIETTVALARSSNVKEFIESLRSVRYEHGCVQWKRRNHYMTSWITNNTRQGIIKGVAVSAVPTVDRERVLNVLPGLAERRIVVRCVPKTAAPQLQAHLENGDLIFFASTQKNLDVFHAGIIACSQNEVRLRHASRSRGSVVEQKLTEFFKANRMAGIIVARPRDASH